MKALILFVVFLACISKYYCDETDFYKLLGVSRDATVKEIRKAFKNLAVKLHPDKNQEEENAEAKFIEIARAYEVLKDPESRKHYDIHGDSEFKKKKQNYHSYSYYRDQFGIYDDDPLIVTLSKNDYEVNVLDKNQAWFVNFYSPNCHHCHELAPTWRKLAAELEGVLRIAAVNCEDDWSLCYQLSIEAYPTLLYYEKEANLYEGKKYKGDRTISALKEFVLSKVKVDIKDVTHTQWNDLEYKKQDALLFLCAEDSVNCPEKETMVKLGAILDGLISVGTITDSELCKTLTKQYKTEPVILWHSSKLHNIKGSDTKEILENILNILPNPETINEEKFKEIRIKLRAETEKPWLICFYLGPATELNLQLKRLPTQIPDINIGLIHCGRSSALCASLHVARYPTWGVLKVGGAFELHYGRDIIHEVATFARDSVKSTNLHALSPADFHNLLKQGSAWFVDWYAPWCPPCRKLMPEIRKASQHFLPEQVQFGTVDCTLHKNLCTEQGISSYPITVLYNNSKIHRFVGVPNEEGITEFVNDVINPQVISLDESNFIQLMRKSEDELWAVDFFAPWCGPCQKLSPEWRKYAKQMTEFPQVKIAQLDCVENADLCNSLKIQAYPTIRIYPLGSKGLSSVLNYNGHRDTVSLKRFTLELLPSPVETLTSKQFKQEILNKKFKMPWLVEFYAPWCGHCTEFEPEFRSVATKLEGAVKSAKIDCEAERFFCGEMHVRSYPTVILYLNQHEHHSIDSQYGIEIIKQVRKLILNYENRNYHDEL